MLLSLKIRKPAGTLRSLFPAPLTCKAKLLGGSDRSLLTWWIELPFLSLSLCVRHQRSNCIRMLQELIATIQSLDAVLLLIWISPLSFIWPGQTQSVSTPRSQVAEDWEPSLAFWRAWLPSVPSLQILPLS